LFAEGQIKRPNRYEKSGGNCSNRDVANIDLGNVAGPGKRRSKGTLQKYLEF
jgi:hypothetical protein